MSRLPATSLAGALLIAAIAPVPALAQSIGYDDVSQGGEATGGASQGSGRKSSRGAVTGRRAEDRTFVEPYIEVGQVVTNEFSPGNEVFTYSRVSAGVDAAVAGRRSGASISARYERDIPTDGSSNDKDFVSGVASGYVTVSPGIQLQAGALATRLQVDRNGSAIQGAPRFNDKVTQVYSVYAGPSFAGQVGEVGISANYNFGYTRTEEPNGFTPAPGAEAVDLFDDSTVHMASFQASVKPDTVLPVGLGVGGTYYREDITNLDQRVEDKQAQATVTVQVTPSVQLSAGAGYEQVEISSRDALRDANGNVVIGPHGHLVTDKAGPRFLAYDVDGLIWDAGVAWRPSRRTSLTAHVGRRYGSTSVTGTFAYAPDERSTLNVLVYDNVAGFGGQLTRALVGLPKDFFAVRDPLSGDVTGCVSSLEAGNCLAGALGSIRSSVFRGRGVSAEYTRRFGRLSAGVGAGYDRRKFIGAPGTILETSDGVVDEDYWLVGHIGSKLDEKSSFMALFHANWFQTGGEFAGDIKTLGATASYSRSLTNHISATAALDLDGIEREAPLDDYWSASAYLGVRYNF